MAEAPLDPQIADEGEFPSGAQSARRLLARLKAAVIVLAIVLVECTAAYFFMPSAETASAAAEEKLAAEAAPAEELAGEVPVAEEKPQTEVELGHFSVTSYQPTTNTTLRIDFQLYGTVLQSDLSEFNRLQGDAKHRVRDQVIVIIRSAELPDLADAGLGLIKRKILERINRTLGKPLLQEVIFSDFSFIEQ